MPDVISHIQTFRDYFHYHIKASKVGGALGDVTGRDPFLTCHLRLIFTRVCGNAPPTSSRFSGEPGPIPKKRRRRQQVEGHSRLVLKEFMQNRFVCHITTVPLFEIPHHVSGLSAKAAEDDHLQPSNTDDNINHYPNHFTRSLWGGLDSVAVGYA